MTVGEDVLKTTYIWELYHKVGMYLWCYQSTTWQCSNNDYKKTHTTKINKEGQSPHDLMSFKQPKIPALRSAQRVWKRSWRFRMHQQWWLYIISSKVNSDLGDSWHSPSVISSPKNTPRNKGEMSFSLPPNYLCC